MLVMRISGGAFGDAKTAATRPGTTPEMRQLPKVGARSGFETMVGGSGGAGSPAIDVLHTEV
jgi:hypothetical protein